MIGKMIYTCPGHFQSEERIFPALPVPGASMLSVSEESAGSGCSFGVAITPSSCYELMQMDPEKRAVLLRQIYGRDGLGLSIGRLCIGSCDYSPELYSYDDVPFDTALTHFSVRRDEAYVIPMIREILAVNPDLTLFASPWSPPFWMKTGGSMCGGYMREAFLDCYAEYIVKFIRAYAEYGIRISAVTPQNEPNTQENGRMPACIWHPETEAKFIGLLKEKFAATGLDIKIWMYDHNFADVSRIQWSLRNCEGLREHCDGIAFHYYHGDLEDTRILREQFPELELHFTEGGPRLNDHYDSDWCKWGLMAVKALNTGYRSFTGWNLMLNELGGPNIGPFSGICGGFVTFDHRTKELSFSGQYKAFSHIVPYLTPGASLYPVSVRETYRFDMGKYPNGTHAVEGTVIECGAEKTAAVLINPNSHAVQAEIKLGGALWYVELQADSISTLIVS